MRYLFDIMNVLYGPMEFQVVGVFFDTYLYIWLIYM